MNFSLSIDKLFKYLEKISPVVITMSIVSGLMLFAPYSIKEKLFLTDISVRELRIISTIFLFSVSLTLLLLIESCICSAKKRTMVKKCKKHYLTLENSQKQIILQALQSKTGGVLLDTASRNAQYLVTLGYLFLPSQPVEIDFFQMKCKQNMFHSRGLLRNITKIQIFSKSYNNVSFLKYKAMSL